jgi:transposase
MSEITTIGLDLAKHVFQVHGIDAKGTTVLRRRPRRNQVLAFFSRLPRCVVGLEACATAHYWARELGALGHEVRLMPAQYVKAYVKRNKSVSFSRHSGINVSEIKKMKPVVRDLFTYNLLMTRVS